MSILEEFYYGNIYPNDKCYQNNCEYAAYTKITTENKLKISAL